MRIRKGRFKSRGEIKIIYGEYFSLVGVLFGVLFLNQFRAKKILIRLSSRFWWNVLTLQHRRQFTFVYCEILLRSRFKIRFRDVELFEGNVNRFVTGLLYGHI